MLASAGHDRDVKVWDVNSEEEVLTMIGHEENVYDLQWNTDGSQLLTTCRDRYVCVCVCVAVYLYARVCVCL